MVVVVAVVSRVVGLAAEIQRRAWPAVVEGQRQIQWRWLDPDNEDDRARTEQVLQDAEVVLADPPAIASLVPHCRSARWLHSTYAGVNALFAGSTSEERKLPQVLTRMTGFGPLTSDYVVGQIIAHERRLLQYAMLQRERTWLGERVPYRTMRELTLGIVGATGDIGSAIGTTAKALGMRVVGYARRPRADAATALPHIDRLYTGSDQLASFLGEPDYIVSIVPSTKLTINMLGDDVLKACEAKRPVLLNVGRGDVITERDIIAALDQGWLSHAVLDVFPVEPLPQSSPLWSHPRVTITPHVSAVSFAPAVVDSFAENWALYTQGNPLRHQVDPTQGY